MGQLQERWDAIGYTEAAEIAQNILGSDDPTAAYQAEIAGKTAEQILAIEISLFAYHPEGNAANINTWRTATFEDFNTFRETNANMTAIAGPPATRPEAPATPEALSVDGNTISIATADGHTVEIEYRFNEDAFRESEYGFRIKVDGEIVNHDRLGVGANSTIATQALAEHRDAIVAAMTPILAERFQMTDSGEVDVINKADLENVFDGIRTSLGNVDGTLLEVVDALTVQAVRDAVNGLDPVVIAADTKADFLSGSEFTSALSVAEEVLAQDKVNIAPIATVEPEPELARTRYDFITKFDSEDVTTEAHDPNAMSQADLNTEWAKFHNDAFDRALSETELEAIALANVMYKRNAENNGWEWDAEAAELTLEQAQAHPDYIAVMEAHAAFVAAPTEPSITIAAGTAPAALSITTTNIADAAALATYLEANGAALDQQARDILYGTADDDGITMDEASAAMDKINTQLDTVEAGSLEETILKRVAEAINQDWDVANIAAREAEESVDVETAVGGDPRIETETGGDPAIREIQLYAAMAKLGNFAPLQAIEISEIDGLSGRKTGNSMINILDMTGTELRALAGPQAAADLIDQKMRDNADFRGNVLAGLRDAVSTDPEDVREFLQMQGVIEADVALTAEELTAKIADYEATLGDAAATVEANVSISVPVDETIAFDVTIAGVTTAEEMTAYLAENGERIDTEIRTALYSDITAINVDDGLSAEELTMLNGWIDAQMEGASDIEKVLLERARGIVETDTTPGADTEITVTANTALIDDDRVLDGNILEDAQAVIARAGGDVPDAGILAIIEGSPMLVRQIEGETIVTQIHEDNFSSVLGEGVAMDSHLEGKLRERADMGDTSVRYRDVTIGVNPATANLLGTDSITIQQGRKDGLVNTFVSESTGKGVIIESEELADAIDRFDGRAGDERLVTHYNLPGEFDSATVARGLDALERAIDNNGAGSLSVEFVEGATGTTAEINYGDGQKLEIPKGLYDAIMERASQEATRDHSQVVEVSAPTAGMGA